jgi:membrane associated rhomboid family serine protease
MRYIAQIFSFFVWLIGTITSLLAKMNPILDDGISIVAGIIGVIGGVVWLALLRIKLKNEKIENKIKNQQLIELQKKNRE